jgi:hypothetical protein
MIADIRLLHGRCLSACRVQLGEHRQAIKPRSVCTHDGLQQFNKISFQALPRYMNQHVRREDLNMLNITNPTVTGEQAWGLFSPDIR